VKFHPATTPAPRPVYRVIMASLNAVNGVALETKPAALMISWTGPM